MVGRYKNMNKVTLKFCTLLFLIAIGTPLFGQIGISTAYRINDANAWKLAPAADPSQETELLGNGISLGLDYWFRLKNQRIEFMPEVNYAQFDQFQLNGSDLDRSNRAFSFFFNANIYPLDLVSDCNCPTFSKQNDLFQKGFFVQLSPGFSYFMHELASEERKVETTSSAVSMGLALGLDVGVSNILTISPLVGFRYFFGAELEDITDPELPLIDNLLLQDTGSNISQFYTGLRVGWRFDRRNY